MNSSDLFERPNGTLLSVERPHEVFGRPRGVLKYVGIENAMRRAGTIRLRALHACGFKLAILCIRQKLTS